MKQKHRLKHFKFHPTAQAIIAFVLLVIAIVITQSAGIAEWEISLFNSIYGLPGYLQPIFFVVTQFGSIWMLFVLLILYSTKKHYHIVLRLLMTGTLAYLLSGFAKDLWGRARPGDILEHIINLDYVVRGPGFPSGHTALATALALTMGHYLPSKYRWLVVVWIAGVAVSRIYLGIHFPMDILGGFAIGWLSYALFRHVRLYDITTRKKAKSK